mgnify:CR=1 FL=1
MEDVYNDINPVYLLGNHDLHYLSTLWNNFQCSGWSRSKHDILHKQYQKMAHQNMFQFHYANFEYNFLVTHAGLNLKLIMALIGFDIKKDDEQITLKLIDKKLEDWLLNMMRFVNTNKRSPRKEDLLYQLFKVGFISTQSEPRINDLGGIVWSRPDEMLYALHQFDFEIMPTEFIQIAGHTRQDTINFNSKLKTYFIDVLGQQHMVLQINQDGFQKLILK